MELHLASISESIADAVPEENALIHGPRVRTWREFDERAARLAAGLRAAGVGNGTKVALDLYNCSENLEAFFATVKLNAVHVNVNYRYRHEELRQLLDDADAEVVIVHASLADRIREIAPRLPLLRQTVEVHRSRCRPCWLGARGPHRQPSTDRPHRRQGGMYLSYTGGTTGLPKGVMYEMAGVTQRTLDTRALICGVDVDWAAGPAAAAVELRDRGERPVADAGIAADAQHGVHVRVAAGVDLRRCHRHARRPPVRPRRHARPRSTSCTQRSWRSSATPSAARSCRRSTRGRRTARPNTRRASGWSARPVWRGARTPSGGSWITCPRRRWSTCAGRPRAARTASASCATATTSVRRGSHGRRGRSSSMNMVSEAAVGEMGMIAAVTQTSGYYKHPEKTAATFRTIDGERYVVPGDLGRIEPDGSITLLGRGSSVVNTGGEKVHPEEVEDVLKSLPQVVDAIVVGIPDDRLGQTVAAVVQPTPGASLSALDLETAVREHLAGYKAPRRIVFVEEIPCSPNGKADLATASRPGGCGMTSGQDLDHGLRARAFGEVLAGLDEVGAPQRLCRVGLACLDVLDEAAVRPGAPMGRLRGGAAGIPGEPGPVGLVDDVAHHAVEQRQRVVPGEDDHEGVELGVQADEPIGLVDCCLGFLDLRPQLVEVGLGAALGGPRRARHLDHRPRQVDVVHRRAAVLEDDPRVAGRDVQCRSVHASSAPRAVRTLISASDSSTRNASRSVGREMP